MKFADKQKKINEAVKEVERKDTKRGSGDRRTKEMSNGDLPHQTEKDQRNRASTSNQ